MLYYWHSKWLMSGSEQSGPQPTRAKTFPHCPLRPCDIPSAQIHSRLLGRSSLLPFATPKSLNYDWKGSGFKAIQVEHSGLLAAMVRVKMFLKCMVCFLISVSHNQQCHTDNDCVFQSPGWIKMCMYWLIKKISLHD